MRAYVGTKIILAEPMSRAEAATLLAMPGQLHDEPGYLVQYPDGYRSWSPKAVFEEAYRLISNGEAKMISPEDRGYVSMLEVSPVDESTEGLTDTPKKIDIVP